MDTISNRLNREGLTVLASVTLMSVSEFRARLRQTWRGTISDPHSPKYEHLNILEHRLLNSFDSAHPDATNWYAVIVSTAHDLDIGGTQVASEIDESACCHLFEDLHYAIQAAENHPSLQFMGTLPRVDRIVAVNGLGIVAHYVIKLDAQWVDSDPNVPQLSYVEEEPHDYGLPRLPPPLQLTPLSDWAVRNTAYPVSLGKVEGFPEGESDDEHDKPDEFRALVDAIMGIRD